MFSALRTAILYSLVSAVLSTSKMLLVPLSSSLAAGPFVLDLLFIPPLTFLFYSFSVSTSSSTLATIKAASSLNFILSAIASKSAFSQSSSNSSSDSSFFTTFFGAATDLVSFFESICSTSWVSSSLVSSSLVSPSYSSVLFCFFLSLFLFLRII